MQPSERVRHPARTLCVVGISANRERMAQTVRESIGLVTALNPYIGYSAASEVAREALATGRARIRTWFWKQNCSPRKQLDEILRPENLTPARAPAAARTVAGEEGIG